MSTYRNIGGANSGLGEWLLQRLSAIYLAGFLLWLAVHLITEPPADYASWHAWLAKGAVRLAFALFVFALLVHAWVGLRSVFLDYVKPAALRLVIQVLTASGLMLLALWSAQILLGVVAR